MKKSKAIIYDDEIFLAAQECFEITMKSFKKKLVKLHADATLPRYNEIIVVLNYKIPYPMPVLFLKVFRTGSKIGDDNYYSYPLTVETLQTGKKYKIKFMQFDAFALPFDKIEVSVISKQDYLKRQLNVNAVNRAHEETISIRKV